jgi:very-short-patch-repair endonuclease
MRKSHLIFTIAQLQALEKRGMRVNWPKDLLDQQGKPKRIKKKCPYKERMLRQLIMVLSDYPELELKKEHHFAKPKQYRFDFAIPAVKIAVEYEGIFSPISRHTSKTGFVGDAEKYNLATAMGWRVLRYTANTVDNLKSEIEKCLLILNQKGSSS